MKAIKLITSLVVVLATLLQFASCEQKSNKHMKAPKAKKIKKEFVEFDNTRTDNYYWLNDREDQEVIDYLNAENDYTIEVMKETEALQGKLYDEILSRIKQTDMSVPYTLNGYEYYTRFEEGKEYPIYCRKKSGNKPVEEIILNGNEMAVGHAFFQIGGWEVSTNNEMLVYSVDTVSRRKYTIHFKNLKTGKTYKENIPNTSGNVTWANDNKTVFYAIKDETLRPYQIFKHKLGNDIKNDQMVFHEDDPTYSTYVYKTKSDKFLVIGSGSTLSNEYRVLDAFKPDGEFKVFQKRQPKLEYSISHQGNRWLVITNLDAKNFKLMECPENKTTVANWKELVAHRKDVLLEDVDVFSDFYVLAERKNGLIKFRIVDLKHDKDFYVGFDEEDYSVYTTSNPEYKSEKLRYSFTSLKTPSSVFDYDIVTKDRTLLKQYEVLGGYNPDEYQTERLYATARDGVRVPISIVYKKGFKKDGSQPLLLYAYGSYGYSMESYFSSSRLSLLDRGFAYAVAHVRGGQELGRSWYENGKLLNKKNTFYDFIDCANYLVDQKYTANDKMFAMGGSAGGLLVGAVINYEPLLFKGVIAAVPFVDVVTTMLDESIPLTTGEYDEWGNPNDEEYYNYILSYSPYDQVDAVNYTNMLVTTGLHDSQVQYWEPAKWVAKLREMKTDDNVLLLKTNMDFGHGGASGRFERYKEVALEYAFMLMLLDQYQ
jgi:oligopeptidase B